MPAVCGVLTQTDHDYGSSISTNGVGAPVVHRVPEHVGQVDLDRRRAEPLPAPVVAPKDDAVGGGVEVGRERATERRKEREEALCFPRDGRAPLCALRVRRVVRLVPHQEAQAVREGPQRRLCGVVSFVKVRAPREVEVRQRARVRRMRPRRPHVPHGSDQRRAFRRAQGASDGHKVRRRPVEHLDGLVASMPKARRVETHGEECHRAGKTDARGWKQSPPRQQRGRGAGERDQKQASVGAEVAEERHWEE
mmetsp:Transcript_27250/g.90553  ORF Transcript_27250/g.90553 Transcript_27250/m.90553 type:complete len:251 (+) Transcript_27250:399-1151(+)